jgi:IstB-like ATP binding protein
MRKLFILYFLLPLMAWGQSLLPPCQGSNALHWSFCFGTAFTDLARRDLLEIFDDRHELRSTLVTSQLPVEHWHDNLGDPTLADAILDRLVHNHRCGSPDGFYTGSRPPALEARCRPPVHNPAPASKPHHPQPLPPNDRIKHN